MRKKIVWMFLLCAGCAISGGSSIKYPQGWPIKALTVPAGAKQLPLANADGKQQLTRDGELQAEGSQSERTAWELAFSYSGSAEQIVAHLEQALKDEGFQRAKARTMPGKQYWYLTPDGRRQVRLEYKDMRAIPLAGTKAWQGYELGISIWKQPRPDVSQMGLEPIP